MYTKIRNITLGITAILLGACTPEENADPDPDITVESITVSPDRLELKKGETQTLQIKILPSEAQAGELTWTSDHPEVATVDPQGLVTAMNAGKAEVKVETENGRSDVCLVNVLEDITPESILLNKEELTLKRVGDSYLLKATVLPIDAPQQVVWTTSDKTTASVDEGGLVTATGSGSATISASAGELTATCKVTVAGAEIQMGDFYYMDGTCSSELRADQAPVGIVFWLGDPTQEDPALKKEHPGCTHGLVVSVRQSMLAPGWQMAFQLYHGQVGSWIEENTSYTTITSPHKENELLNKIMGYSNTKGIEAFNADPDNSNWPVDAVASIVSFRQENPTPEASSDWFLPSTRELALLIHGEYEGEVLKVTGTANKKFINYKLSLVEGSSPIGKLNWQEEDWDYDLWASCERDEIYAFFISTFEGKIYMGEKDFHSEFFLVRPVLAF